MQTVARVPDDAARCDRCPVCATAGWATGAGFAAMCGSSWCDVDGVRFCAPSCRIIASKNVVIAELEARLAEPAA